MFVCKNAKTTLQYVKTCKHATKNYCFKNISVLLHTHSQFLPQTANALRYFFWLPFDTGWFNFVRIFFHCHFSLKKNVYVKTAREIGRQNYAGFERENYIGLALCYRFVISTFVFLFGCFRRDGIGAREARPVPWLTFY